MSDVLLAKALGLEKEAGVKDWYRTLKSGIKSKGRHWGKRLGFKKRPAKVKTTPVPPNTDPLKKVEYVAKKEAPMVEETGKALRRAAWGIPLGAGVATGVYGAGKGIEAVERRMDYKTSKKRLKAHSPDLFKPAEVKSTKMYLRTINRLAPTLARDPVVSSAFVKRAKQMPEAGLSMARDLAGVESSLRKLRGGRLSEDVGSMISRTALPGG